MPPPIGIITVTHICESRVFRPTVRLLRRSPGLSTGIIVTIALGVAALTTTFGVLNAALFRQPPFEEAERLALVFVERHPRGESPRRERWSFGRYELLSKSQQSFESIASYSPASITLSVGTTASLVAAERVSASFFPVLRVTPLLGRLFSADEDNPAGPSPVAIISETLWTRELGRDSSILGRTIRLNSVPVTVVGVVHASFKGMSGRSELWIPRTMSARITYPEYVTTNQNFISVVGRLRDGVTLDAARHELAVLGRRINEVLPSDPEFPQEPVGASAVLVNDARTDDNVRRSLFVLFGAVTLLHLLACANVINVLLGRAAAKGRDSAIRVALGSSSGRLFTESFGEAVTLAAIGGVAGLIIAAVASGFIAPPQNVWTSRSFYGSIAPFDAPSFGAAEIVFGAMLIALTALLVALPSALSVFRVNMALGLSESAGRVSSGGLTLRRPSARALIVGLEATLAMVLLVAAGLLVDSFRRVQNVDAGIDDRNVLTFWVVPSEARYPVESAPAFVTRLLEAVERIPGVVSATVDGGGPFVGAASSTLRIAGRAEPAMGQAPTVLRHYIGPDHFRTLDIPVLRGRAFRRSDDAHAPRVVIISQSAAQRFWPEENPIGKRVWFAGGSSYNSVETSGEIVGVVGDVIYNPLDRVQNHASFYTPYMQFTYPSRMVFVKTAVDPISLISSLRKALTTVDPDLAMQDARTLSDIVVGSRARNRFDALLFSTFGAAALFLAATGIFAVLAYAMATRTREFGIRAALGASPHQVLHQVLVEGMVFPAIGLAVGAAIAIASGRLLHASLYEVRSVEPGVLLFAVVVMLLVSVGACLIPAIRATRVDTVKALKAD